MVSPGYDPAVLSGDICLVQLEKPLIMSSEKRTAVVELPPAGYLASGHANITQLEQSSDVEVSLVQVTVPNIPDNDCREKYEDVEINIVDEMICAGDKGQSLNFQIEGGPLVDSEGNLVGTLSLVYGGEVGEYPDIYAEVSYWTQWVKAILEHF